MKGYSFTGPYHALAQLQRPDFDDAPELAELRQLARSIVDGTHGGYYTTFEELRGRVEQWVASESPRPTEQWELDD